VNLLGVRILSKDKLDVGQQLVGKPELFRTRE
jgi:hypothetical protein